jgi:hypothetical protein
MGRTVVSENVSLDGVIQDPAGVEGFSRGGWVGRICGTVATRRPKLRSTRRWAGCRSAATPLVPRTYFLATKATIPSSAVASRPV